MKAYQCTTREVSCKFLEQLYIIRKCRLTCALEDRYPTNPSRKYISSANAELLTHCERGVPQIISANAGLVNIHKPTNCIRIRLPQMRTQIYQAH